MVSSPDEVKAIKDFFGRIVEGAETERDIEGFIEFLRQTFEHNGKVTFQFGKQVVNIGKIEEGKGIQIGDRITHEEINAKTIWRLLHSLRSLLQRSLLQEEKVPVGQTKPLVLTGADGLGKLSNVPEPPQNFLPRPEVLESLKALVSDPASRTIAVTGKSHKVGVQGMGGIGKSVLAAALARDKEVRRQFPNGIVWVTLNQNPVIASRQAQVYTALTGKPIEFKDEQDGRARLSELLVEVACLIILDDVWKLEHANAFNALGNRCQMLITTRDAEIVSALVPQQYRYQLDVLTKNQSLQLLAKVSEQAAKILPKEAQDVAKECGYLPLALAMAGGVVKGKPHLWNGLLKHLQNADLEKIQQQFPDYPYHDLLRAIQVSVDTLEVQERERYFDFAVFPENTLIPITVLQVLWESEGLDELDANIIVSTLVNRSLVQQDSQGRLALHDLQLDYVRKQVENLSTLYKRFPIPATAIEFVRKQVEDFPHDAVIERRSWTGRLLPEDNGYAVHLPYHLAYGGMIDELRQILTDFDFLEYKVSISGLQPLIEDYSLALQSEIQLKRQTKKSLRLIQSALYLSAHVLARDHTQLAGQLWGRLQVQKNPEIQNLLQQARQTTGIPWLRPLTASLTPPGGPLLRVLAGHQAPVLSIAVTSDGLRVVSGSSDKTLKVWNLEQGTELFTLQGHQAPVLSVAVTPDGRQAVSGSSDKTLRVWDLERNSTAPVLTIIGHQSWISSIVVTPDSKRAISGSFDKTLRVWDLERRLGLFTLKGHKSWIWCVAVTPDGRQAISGSFDKTLKVWDLEQGKELFTLIGHQAGIWCVAITPDGKRAISGSEDKTLKVWDLERATELSTLIGHQAGIWCVAITPDGKRAISGSEDKTLKVWDLERATELFTVFERPFLIWSLALFPNGTQAISGSFHSFDKVLRVWDLSIAGNLKTPTGHTDFVRDIAITSDGKIAVSASDDSTLKVWDVHSGEELKTLRGHTRGVWAVAITPDSQQVVSGSQDGALKIWDLHLGKPIKTLMGHTEAITAIAITPDGHQAVSASYDESLGIWDLHSGKRLQTMQGHIGLVNSVAITPDSRLAVSASLDSTLIVWELQSGKALKILKGHPDSVEAIAITPDGRLVISGGLNDNNLRLWDLQARKALGVIQGDFNSTNSIAITPDGQFAVCALDDTWENFLEVFDLDVREALKRLRGHSASIAEVAVSPNGQLAISVSADHTLKVWELSRGEEIASFTADGGLVCCAFAPNGVIVAGEESGRMHFLRLEGYCHI